MSYDRVVISSGHGKYIRGASGSPVPPQLDEVDEARRLTERIAELLRERDVWVKTFHDDTSHDQSTNLSTIVAAHNREDRQLDISTHFNAFDGHAHGTEVLYVSQSALAGKLSSAIAANGFTNRGPKYRGDLYFLNNTAEPAVLLEVAFCDNTADSETYRAKFEDIADAIADVIGGAADAEAPEPPPATSSARVNITTEGDVQVYVNGELVGR